MTSPTIQKDLINCCAKETTKRIIEELVDDFFSILADESSDIAQKEQLTLCLRYVDGKTRMIVQRFLGLGYVGDTTALTLKSAIMSSLVEYSLSPAKIRGQGYDGASNIKGEISGLKTLMMKETPCAYYVHCFAHQLQLTIIAVAKKKIAVGFFETLANMLSVVGVSCKRRELIRESQPKKVVKALEMGECESGSGLNQELGLKRPGDTCWGSHYKNILNVIHLFPTIVEVLEMIGNNALSSEYRVKAQSILYYSFESFDFVFVAHLMLTIFGCTNDLCFALQRRDQDIVNAMSLVSLTKQMLQKARDYGWKTFLNKTTLFCTKYDIIVSNIDTPYVPRGRSRCFVQQATNIQHFRVELFIGMIDLQLQELNGLFDEVNMELLMCMACLSPKDDFSSFDKEKVLKLASFYPSEFSSI